MRRRKAFRAPALVLCVAFLLAGAALAPAQAAFSLDSLPASSRLDLAVLPDATQRLEYRFLPDGPWLPLDAGLALSAAPGEERAYAFETRAGREGSASPHRVVIDKRAPLVPLAEPESGLYREAFEPRLSSRDGARLRYAILGPAGLSGGGASSDAAFQDWLPGKPLRLAPAPAGALSLSLLVMAVDEAGNESPVARRDYRLAAPGLDYAAPRPAAAPAAFVADPLEALGDPLVASLPGRVELSFASPAEGILLAAVNAPAGRADEAVYQALPVQGGRARLVLECPRGWKSSFAVSFALRKGNEVRYREAPFRVELANRVVSARPAGPSLLQGSEGGPSFLVFPAYDGSILYSLASQPYLPYAGPVALPPGGEAVTVSWYGLDRSGMPSESQSASLARLAAYVPTRLEGAKDGALTNEAVQLSPAGVARLRYEISNDGSAPREPDASSPLVDEALAVDAAPGAETTFRIRYRGFAGEAASTPVDEGGILSFTIDHKAPDAPRPASNPPAYTSTPLRLELLSEGNDVYASVEGGGLSTQGSRLDAPLLLPGNGESAVEYLVRAWSVDKAGNRSTEMKPIRVVVDIATLYVQGDPGLVGSLTPAAASGSPAADEDSDTVREASGDGSRDRPFATLDEALAFAAEADSGRSAICVRGRVPFSGQAKFPGRNLSIRGGFDADWRPVPGARAVLVVTRSAPQSQPLFDLAGSRFSLSGLEFELAAGGTLISARASSLLQAENLGFTVRGSGGQGDFLAFDLDASRLELSGSTVDIREAQSAALVQSTGSEIKAGDCRISAAQGVRYFTAFSLSGGSLALETSTITSAASLATRLLALESASITLDRSFLDVAGGPGFLSVASFTNANGIVSDSHVRVAWKGVATLFRFSGGGPAFVHDSVAARTQKGRLRFFDSDGAAPSIRNSIFASVADSGEFLVATGAIQSGLVTANCLSGFTTVASQAGASLDLAGLNALNAKTKGSRPNLTEAMAKTWPASPFDKEGSFSLGPESLCLDAAAQISGFPRDFAGNPRPQAADKARPDIGADEKQP